MRKILNENNIIIAVFIVCALSYISLIFNTNVWMDEAFTGALVHTSFAGVLYRSMMDTLPPLYNIILKLMTDIFGYSVPVMKITSVIPMILTMVLGITKVRKRFGAVSAAAFILCVTGMPLMLNYGVEIRMYSLGFFFATASGIYAYELVCDYNRKNLAGFVAFSVLAGYSHHFAFVTVGMVFFFLLLYYLIFDRSNIKRWLFSLLFTFIFYLPCMIITLKQFANVSGYFSMPDVDLHMFIQYVLYPYIVGISPASALCILIVAVCIVAGIMRLFKHPEDRYDTAYSLICFSIYYCVLLFGVVITKIMTANIFVDRYLFFSTGLLWLCICVQIGKLSRKTILTAASFGVLVFICICSYIVEYKIEYSQSADEEIEFLANNVNDGDIFFGIGGHEEMECCIPFLSLLNDSGNSLELVYPLDKALSTASNNPSVTLWISVLDGFSPSEEDNVLLQQYGFTMEEASDFEFDRYKCKLYKAVKNK